MLQTIHVSFSIEIELDKFVHVGPYEAPAETAGYVSDKFAEDVDEKMGLTPGTTKVSFVDWEPIQEAGEEESVRY